MLVTRGRSAVFVPVALLGFTAGLAVVGILNVVKRPGLGPALGAVLCVGFFLLMVSDVRRLVVEGTRLRVRSPFDQKELDVACTKVGVLTNFTSRGGVTYTVYAYDGLKRADVSEHWNEDEAHEAARRFAGILDTDSDEPLLHHRLLVHKRRVGPDPFRKVKWFLLFGMFVSLASAAALVAIHRGFRLP